MGYTRKSGKNWTRMEEVVVYWASRSAIRLDEKKPDWNETERKAT